MKSRREIDKIAERIRERIFADFRDLILQIEKHKLKQNECETEEFDKLARESFGRSNQK